MRFAAVDKGVDIYYELHADGAKDAQKLHTVNGASDAEPKSGHEAPTRAESPTERNVAEHGTRVMFICGLSALGSTGFFSPLVSHLTSLRDASGNSIQICTFDNRGVGQSTTPAFSRKDPSNYSTPVMARDTLGLLDHLGWESVHLIGMSLGGMIASKVAAVAPRRVRSLTIINSTAHGFHMVMSMLQSPILLSALASPMASLKTKLYGNLRCNFSPQFLEAKVPLSGKSRAAIMTRNTLEAVKGHHAVSSGWKAQSEMGQKGQLHAVFTHKLSDEDVETIRAHSIPTQLISGRHDPIARPRYVRSMAKRLCCQHIITGAAHAGITIESQPEIIRVLETVILGAPRTSEEVLQSMAQAAQQRALEESMTYELVTAYAPARVDRGCPHMAL